MVATDASTEVHLELVVVAQELQARLSPLKAVASKADLAASDTFTPSLVFIMVAVGLVVTETKGSMVVRTPWHLADWVEAVLALFIPIQLTLTGHTAHLIQAEVAAVGGIYRGLRMEAGVEVALRSFHT